MLNRRWSFAVWFPFFAGSVIAAVYLFSGTVHNGFGAFAAIPFLLIGFLRLASILILLACVVSRPRGPAWNIRAVTLTLLAWGSISAAAVVYYLKVIATDITIRVKLVDNMKRPLQGAKIEYTWSKRSILFDSTDKKGEAIADAEGIASFRVRSIDDVYIRGDGARHPNHSIQISKRERYGVPELSVNYVDNTPMAYSHLQNPLRIAPEIFAGSIEFDDVGLLPQR